MSEEQKPKFAFLNAHLAQRLNKEREAVNRVKTERPQFPAPKPKPLGTVPDTTASPSPTEVKKKLYISTTGADDLEEYWDEEEIVKQKAKLVAELIRAAKCFVIYTGAGISTAAKIPDYRSKTGVWTMLEKGEKVQKEIELDQAAPTSAHYAVKTLIDRGLCQFVISTNIDGLHRRSGIPADKLAEIHGNCYLEKCPKCSSEYLREFNCIKNTMSNITVTSTDNQQATDTSNQRGDSHLTGRVCESGGCSGLLRDSIIHFGESLPEKEFQAAASIGERVDLALVLGSSMRVSPACNMPRRVLRNGTASGKLIVVNLQKTPFEDDIWIHIHADIDQVMKYILDDLQQS